jgi:lambda family phage tail tape measure protein
MALEIAKELFNVLVIQRMVAAMKGLMGFSDGGAFNGGQVLANANGNAFSGGNVVPFASGGVVNSPTLFPMQSGIGLMGEAGPEAIMPLSRGSDGKLGVKASGGEGGSGGGSSDGGTTVINVLDPALVGQYMDTAEGRRKIMNIIGEEQAA